MQKLSTPFAKEMQKDYPVPIVNYSVKAAAIATGVSESSLRTWERRYGIPSPARSNSGRRQYSEEDLAIVRRMAALVGAGIPASEAAAAVLREEDAVAAVQVPVQEEHPLVQQLTDASLAYDEPAITLTVRASLDLGWDDALERVLFPSLSRIGLYWGEGRVSCATEHFTTEVIRRELNAALAGQPPAPDGAPGVLLACPEAERHDLGILAMSLLLSKRGLRVYYLGADVPVQDLLIAIEKTRAEALCLSATTASGLASLGRTARVLISSRAGKMLFVGGPAFWHGNGDESIPGIRLPRALKDAADAIRGALMEHSNSDT
jgi:DNA-binding transcriptional MerR regulator/methylmalonyl-CoA mutase cobalamin-binding subunit